MEVTFDGKNVGTIAWQPDHWGVYVTLDCAIPCDPLRLLRCYGAAPTGWLLIGLPEPRSGRLTLKRHISREVLRAAGVTEDVPPTAFLLSDGPPDVPSVPVSTVQADTPPMPFIPATPVQVETPPVKSLESQSQTVVQTGDGVLDRLIAEGSVSAAEQDGHVVLSCPFAPDQPFALAPAFVLCEVSNGQALLRYGTAIPKRAQAVPAADSASTVQLI